MGTKYSSWALEARGEMQLLIQGTKNAYTTVRANDLIVYELDFPDNEDSPLGIGLYTNEGELLPMCCRDKFREEFFVDHTRRPLDAGELKNRGKLLRMVSSDRNPTKGCFTISEWIDSSYSIPIVAADELSFNEVVAIRSKEKKEAFEAVQSLASHGSGALIVPADAELLQKKLEVARLELALLEAQTRTGPLIEKVSTTDAPLALGPYSQAMITPSGGRLMFVSGCIALDPSMPPPQALVQGGIGPQTERALASLRAIVTAGGGQVCNIAKVNFFLDDIDHYKEVNAIYAAWLEENGVQGLPARAAFVARLPAGALIEVEAIVAV